VASNDSIADTLDINGLTRILHGFLALTGIPIDFLDPKGYPIIEQEPTNRFCEMIRSHPEGRKRCVGSLPFDRLNLSDNPRLFMELCHACVGHLGMPVMVGGTCIGFVTSSQLMFKQPDKEDLDAMLISISDLDLATPEDLISAYTEIPVIPPSKCMVAIEFMSTRPCPDCNGSRLRPESLAVTVGGKSISDLVRMSIRDASKFFDELKLTERESLIAALVLREIKARLGFMIDVGLDYLTLDRAAGSLAGGEAQRIRLATQIGSGLTGVLYVLDEPSIGLHQRDNRRLLDTLKHLRDLGNTLIVVEHDEETMWAADHIIDIGPGAGAGGGKVVVSGTIGDVMNCAASRSGNRYDFGTVRD
jgi:ligand-binding sensor protein/ABC-type Na+ transport system ATPase subunit NatA